jgi:hypothetical protein
MIIGLILFLHCIFVDGKVVSVVWGHVLTFIQKWDTGACSTQCLMYSYYPSQMRYRIMVNYMLDMLDLHFKCKFEGLTETVVFFLNSDLLLWLLYLLILVAMIQL